MQLIDRLKPGLSAGNAAFHQGYADARWGKERPRVLPTNPAYRCYMLGWVEGSMKRAAENN